MSGDETGADRRRRLWFWGAAAALLLTAAFLPVDALLDALAARFGTVRGFRADFEKGFRMFRIACLVNAVLLAAFPALLRRCAFAPAEGKGPGLRGELLPAGALFLAAAAVAAPGLAASFQDDEWRTLHDYARHGPLIILTRALEPDNHVLYTLLAWPFTALFGLSEIAGRLPALLLTPAAPALLYLLLRRDHSKAAAFFGALPLTAFPFLVQYAHEGRGYGPLFSGVLAMAILHEQALLAGSRRAWVAYVLAGVASVGFHMYGAVGVAALALGPILFHPFRAPAPLARNAAAATVVGGASFLLYSFHLPQYFVYSPLWRPAGAAPPDVSGFFPGTTAGEYALLCLAPYAVAFAIGVRSRGCRPALLAATTAAFALQWVMLQAAGPGQAARFYTAALALAWIFVGTGMAAVWGRRKWAAVLGASLAAVAVFATVDYYRTGRRDYRAAAAELQARRRPGERLAMLYDARPLTCYLREPVTILETDAIVALDPEWFVGVDRNIKDRPRLAEWLKDRCELQFRLPSARGAIEGYRRKE